MHFFDSPKRLDIVPSLFQCFRDISMGSADPFPRGYIRTQCSGQNNPLSSGDEQISYNIAGSSQSNGVEESHVIRQTRR